MKSAISHAENGVAGVFPHICSASCIDSGAFRQQEVRSAPDSGPSVLQAEKKRSAKRL